MESTDVRAFFVGLAYLREVDIEEKMSLHSYYYLKRAVFLRTNPLHPLIRHTEIGNINIVQLRHFN